MEYKFIVKGKPIAMPKKEVRIAGGYPQFYERQVIHPVTLKKYNPADSWREQICLTAQTVFPKPIPKDIPIQICSWVIIKKPKSVSKKRFSPLVRPDLDNFTYLHHNCLEGVAYIDDSQIVHQDEWKLYDYADAFKEGLYIIIRTLEEDDIMAEYNNLEGSF